MAGRYIEIDWRLERPRGGFLGRREQKEREKRGSIGPTWTDHTPEKSYKIYLFLLWYFEDFGGIL